MELPAGVFRLDRKPMKSTGTIVSVLKQLVIDVDVLAIFSITVTIITRLKTIATTKMRELTFRQPVRTYTLEEENPLDLATAVSPEQLKNQSSEKHHKHPYATIMPTLTSDQSQMKMRKPNQYPRKTTMSNQLRSVFATTRH